MHFYDPWGQHVAPVWKPPPSDSGQLRQLNAATTIHGRTCASGDGEPLDLELAVDALVRATRAPP